MTTRHVYILITFVITWWSLASCATESPASNPRPRVAPEAIEKALADAEPLFKQREDLENIRTAIKMLSAARDPDNRNFQIEWTFAKYNYFLGKFSTDTEEADSALAQGRDAGKLASRIDPQEPEGHFWFAANLGELAKRSPITVGLKSVGDIKESMDKVVELRPDYQSASAYDALAQIEIRTRLNGGDAPKAVELLEKGVGLAPDNPNIRLHLGEAYLAVKRDDHARKQFDHLLQMKPNPEYMPEYRECVEKARKLIETNF